MSSRFRPAHAVALAALALACRTGDAGHDDAASPDSARTAAVVDGRAISVGELDRWIRNELFQRESEGQPAKLYELRAQALERLIQERVIETASEQRNLSREELLRAEVESLGEVTEAEIEAWYADNQARLGGAELDALRPQIQRYLVGERAKQALASLRESAGVQVLLEPPRVEVAADGPSLGPDDARVTIVEFSDFECPYCRRAGPTLKQVMARYPDDVRLVYRHYPLDRIHKRARPAAEASACADAQGKFWAYHDKLFENTRALGDEDLQRYARELGLDEADFSACVREQRFRDKVSEDEAAALAAGVRGTPAFVVNGVLLSGARPAEDFFRVIEQELARDASDPG